jgi:ribosomal protein L37AE/L43A
MPENVTSGTGYIKYIKSKNQPVLTEIEVKEITSKIEIGRLKPSFKTNREHVKHVKLIVEQKESSQSCPKCGGEMVIREVKKGQNMDEDGWAIVGPAWGPDFDFVALYQENLVPIVGQREFIESVHPFLLT